MTETTTPTPDTDSGAQGGRAPKKRAGGLSGMLLPELKQMAGGLGIKGVGGMRKSQLVDAISAAQSGGSANASPSRRRSAQAAQSPGGVAGRRPVRGTRP